ncbi:disease resistance protein RPM1 [Vitis vinifera]|uniref:Disease resistance protein RPM1 n=1 Tax=Vitis vinifera TaxID=29760 RepID=A0A438E3F0_VITVI|nr:disease resistance protein RPM1 [Vitis vinifera]RVW42203.1 Disease resistance protein RPM1 [Vitis vinifera]|eukprot:XP_019078501.1 PREDICTED: disease resistance protein RPM1 [Vitis vinifera]
MVDPEITGGIAASTLSFLLVKLDAFAIREWKLQENIKKSVQNLGCELRNIQAMLRDADSKEEHSHQFTVWIKEVRDQAYAIEDALDLFKLKQESVWRRLKLRHSINDLIQDIERSLQNIQRTKERYRSMASYSTNAGNNTYLHVRVAPLFIGNVDTVGIEEPTNKLVSWALEPKQRLEVMFVVGMAGLGKTTLVHSVYESVKQNFDCHIWITASKSKTKLDILRTLLVEKFGCTITQGGDVVALTHKLRKFLHNKRYVIVLDDLWVKDVWESIRLALPNGKDSRIIITTRRGDIANSWRDDDSVDIHMLQPLSPERAEKLFYKKAFSRNGRCPSGLEEVSKSILQKCDGLPLGIIEIGRLLSIKAPTKNEWKILHDSLESELRGSGGLSNITKVLSASYNDLPFHLKYCFLYMSIFPETSPVKRRRLIRLWIAEGFVIEKGGKTSEEVGEEYLNELIDRSLIKVNEMDFEGRPKSVGVHSLMLKMILSGSERNLSEKTRRLSIQKEDFDVSQDLPCVRTFFSFGIGKVKIGSNFKLLKVLDIQGTPLEEFPGVIKDLLLLRYLSLRNTNIRSIPGTLGDLHHLETLDLKQTLVTKVPKAVLQLEKLRHLLVYRYNMESALPFDIVQGFKAPKRIGALKNLQKLSFVKVSGQHRMSREHRMIQGLDNLTQLRKLGIVELAKERGASLCLSIEKMPNLHSLNVTSLNKEEPLELDAMTNPPPLLQRLYLKGPLNRFPQWATSLHDLERIRLKWSSLTENPIAALQNLPNLTELQLLDAYTGTQLDFNSGKFPKLKILDLQQLEQVRSIMMEEGTLPCLQKLIISHCSRLVQVPRGIDKLIHLQMLLLYDMPGTFVTGLRKNGGQFRRLVHHIPCIHSYNQAQLEDLS